MKDLYAQVLEIAGEYNTTVTHKTGLNEVWLTGKERLQLAKEVCKLNSTVKTLKMSRAIALYY